MKVTKFQRAEKTLELILLIIISQNKSLSGKGIKSD